MSTLTPVVTASDQNVLPGLYALLASLQHFCPNRSVHVLDCGIELEARQRIYQRFPNLNWISLPSDLTLPFPSVASYATYARFQIGDIFAAQARVLYLDADIVLASNINEIDDIALGPSDIVAGCLEPYTPTFASQNGVHDFHRLGFDGGEPYFNAGVLLIRPRAWQEAGIAERAAAYLRRKDVRITLFDQEALNIALAGRWRELAPEWNVSRFWMKPERRDKRPSILDEAKLVHFLSQAKPWSAPQDVHPWLLACYRRFAPDFDLSA